MIPTSIVERLLWLLRKLSNFLKQCFQDAQNFNKQQDSYPEDSNEIFFPYPMKQVDENAYNQMSVVLIIKLAALKLHDFNV